MTNFFLLFQLVCYKQSDFVCDVPANSMIVFEIELLDFRFDDCTKRKDGGVIINRILEKSDKTCCASFGSEVCADILGLKKDMGYEPSETAKFLESLAGPQCTRLIIGDTNEVMNLTSFTWTIGEGELHQIPKGNYNSGVSK